MTCKWPLLPVRLWSLYIARRRVSLAEERRSVYLDNAATTYPKPEQVYLAVERFMREVGGSAGRAGHWRAIETGRMVYSVRQSLASLFGIGDPLRIAFTKNATEAINTAIWGLLKPGDHVVTTSVEHNSVMRPLQAAGRLGISHTVVGCARDGSLDPAALEKEIRPETALVAINHASNVTGTILPAAGYPCCSTRPRRRAASPSTWERTA
jgi:cysteine desulfurase / selenocysteine lyase